DTISGAALDEGSSTGERMTGRTWLTAIATMFATVAAAQQKPNPVEVHRETLADNLFLLSAAGAPAGNAALLTGPDGPVLVDDQSAPLAPGIEAAIRELTGRPVRFVINTHWHNDHTGGNEPLGRSGAVIIAHDNTLKRLKPRTPAVARPAMTFADSVTLRLNDEEIEAVHVANAHTDSDAIVYFKKANVVHTGDVFPGPMYPNVDIAGGGSIDGLIAAVATVLARIDAKTRIIPGHAPPQGKAELEAFRRMLVAVRARIANAIRTGQTVEQVLAAKPTREFDATYGKGAVTPTAFVRRAYADLSRTVQPRDSARCR